MRPMTVVERHHDVNSNGSSSSSSAAAARIEKTVPYSGSTASLDEIATS
ncbi:hypothetical protein HU200_039589 [Digitaria exilis]|uniref:Uncharacterized protein n=1 Tax=Digitaria exilis TaxID=1010633 RepID=A0A835EI90_9POAL|nr:hypothetical protein HU200_039589 [Digitaria exilis]